MQKKSRTQRRRWVTTLASPIPTGPQGQPSHDIGASISIIDLVEVPGVGNVSLSVPRPSMLLLESAHAHMKRAERLRAAAKKQIAKGKWIQPGHELRFTNEELVFDFFAEAMAGVVLALSALDNLLTELVPDNFTHTSKDGEWSRQRIESSMGVERKLTEIAPIATGRPNIRNENVELFDRAMSLKALRDDIGHSKLHRGYGGTELRKTIFSDLFEADLLALVSCVGEIGIHYGAASL